MIVFSFVDELLQWYDDSHIHILDNDSHPNIFFFSLSVLLEANADDQRLDDDRISEASGSANVGGPSLPMFSEDGDT